MTSLQVKTTNRIQLVRYSKKTSAKSKLKARSTVRSSDKQPRVSPPGSLNGEALNPQDSSSGLALAQVTVVDNTIRYDTETPVIETVAVALLKLCV